MAEQTFDRMALNAAIDQLVHEREDGWLQAAQIVVDVGIQLPSTGSKSAVYTPTGEVPRLANHSYRAGLYSMQHNVDYAYVEFGTYIRTKGRDVVHRIYYDPATIRADVLVVIPQVPAPIRVVDAKTVGWLCLEAVKILFRFGPWQFLTVKFRLFRGVNPKVVFSTHPKYKKGDLLPLKK
jgi:hypothetical protein